MLDYKQIKKTHIGDKLFVDYDIGETKAGSYLTVVEDNDHADKYIDSKVHTIELGALMFLCDTLSIKPEVFEIGDRVVVIHSDENTWFTKGEEFEISGDEFAGCYEVYDCIEQRPRYIAERCITKIKSDTSISDTSISDTSASRIEVDGDTFNVYDENDILRVKIDGFNKNQSFENTIGQVVEELGVYRPNLNTRKVGKVRVELVDNGFPLALREIAKVMSWATNAKGYKDHDWQNLPDAENQLAAAASRHRTDHIEQRIVKGWPASKCVDSESQIAHKAHEAFGVLAQLEMLLRGEFDGVPTTAS